MKLSKQITASATIALVVAVVLLVVSLALRHPELSGIELAITAILASAVGVMIAFWMSGRLSRPVEALRATARTLVRGDAAERPVMLGFDEVDDLADSLRRIGEQANGESDGLKALEALLAGLTESLNEGVVAINSRQQVVRINETARQLLRLRAVVPFSTNVLPRDRTMREALASALEGIDASPAESTIDDRMLSITARPLAGGGAVLAFYDVTPFRKLEAVRRDFVGNVSHELRTPLTVISGFVETLQDEEIPPALRQQFLGMVGNNVRRMQRIVDDLLDLSRIESGGWLPDPSDIELHAVANEIFTPLQQLADSKGITLAVNIPENARHVYADATAIRQILTNLAENALRHTTTGSVQLFSENADDGVWVGITDTGSGMGAQHLTRIFERFYRADPSRSRDAGGTGLGLSIVKHLAESHGGKIRAQSTENVGTTIAAWFPDAPLL